MLRIVADTNIRIRVLLRGRATLPVLNAWQAGQFRLITSQALLDEYDATAIDGRADAIVTGDDDLRADDELLTYTAQSQVQL